MEPFIIAGVVVVFLLVITGLFTMVLNTVDAGTIRLVSRFGGDIAVYKGPGKAIVIPLFTTSTTIPSKAINIDLDIQDQTADLDANGNPRPIKVRVLASAIVSVGDSNLMITTAANKFFSKPVAEQTATLSDLLTSTGRRAVNLLNHDELFSAKGSRPKSVETTALEPAQGGQLAPFARVSTLVSPEEDDRLALIIKSACSRELQDLGLVFNSLNIKMVQSEVADARRRQSAVEAKANADIVAADQERRAREAQLAAEQAINDKQRDLEQRRAQNAATVAEAEAKKQTALAIQREAELKATQIAQANADAARVRIAAEAAADAEAVKVRTMGLAQADAIRAVNEAIAQGGDAYLALKQIELIPQVAPAVADALATAKLINISGGGDSKGAAGAATDQIMGVIQTLIATQLVSSQLRFDNSAPVDNTPRFVPASPPVQQVIHPSPAQQSVQQPAPIPGGNGGRR